MRIRNLNPDTEIGASAWLVDTGKHRLLLDAGTHPKREGRAALPLYGQVGTTEVDRPEQVREAVRDASREERAQVLLLVRRDGKERFVAVPFHRG